MSKKVVIGVAAILVVVVTVAVVAAVMISGGGATTNSGNLTKEVKDDSSAAASINKGKDSTTQDDYKESSTKSSTPQGNRQPQGILSEAGSESTTQPAQQPDSTLPANEDEAPPFEEQPSQTPPPPSVTPEVFMQLDNSYHGGVVLKIQDQIQKVVGFDIVGENAEGNNKTLQMETLAGATVMEDVINLGETSFQRHKTSEETPLPGNKRLPSPGLYASRLGDEATTGWFDDAVKNRKLGDSIGILAFEYKGPIFIGVKLIGDHFVPSGEESTRVNTTDSVAKAKWANKGYKNPNWKPSEFHFNEGVDKNGHFRITTTVGKKTWYTEFVHLDEMQKVDAGVAVRFAERPVLSSDFEEEGP